MPVWLQNLQSRVVFNSHLLKLHCGFLLHVLGVGRWDVSVVCVGREEIQNLNRSYRNVDSPTDVLSFPYHEGIVPGTLPQPERECDYNLGDVILGMPVIVEGCREERVRLEHQLPVIVTHGFCHLLGYRHGSELRWKAMYARELSVLTAFNNAFGTQLTPLTEIHNSLASFPGPRTSGVGAWE